MIRAHVGSSLAALAVLFAIAPALSGVVVRTKSAFAGRRGAPVGQLYRDLFKLLRKGTVYSTTTTWVFRAAPVVVLASLTAACLLLPLDGEASLVQFSGDLIAFAGLLALGRFALVLAGLDTGSSFEGMGASREVTVSSFAEPVLFLGFLGLVLATRGLTLSAMLGPALTGAWAHQTASLALVTLAFFVLLLAENSRVPVDDPATHLELTMIHEVIVLDHSGPDLAVILYASALKLALFAALIVEVTVPRDGLGLAWSLAAFVGGLLVVAVAVGVVESVMARLRLNRVPQLIVGAGALALFGLILLLR
ncbi:MAG TPA: NADH-quinone oxidoreductase subunit H [Gemmatimonadaceae bacterium]